MNQLMFAPWFSAEFLEDVRGSGKLTRDEIMTANSDCPRDLELLRQTSVCLRQYLYWVELKDSLYVIE